MASKIGLVGTGPRERTSQRGGGFAIGRIHADAWKRVDDVVIVAACDISADNLDSFCNDYSVEKRFLDFNVMLTESDIDFLSICTWPVLHADMAISAAESGVKGI